MDRQVFAPEDINTEFPAFLNALEAAVNAVALLSGPPLPTRRLGMEFADRAAEVNAAGISLAFDHLLGSINLTLETVQDWIQDWLIAIAVLKKTPDADPFLAEEHQYYKSAFDQFLANHDPSAVVWPLVVTWTRIINSLPDQSQLQIPWIKALTGLGFAGQDYIVKLEALDSFLEMCETLVLGDNIPENGN
jgi:hypothetical protein